MLPLRILLPSSLLLTIYLNPRRDGLRFPFSLPMPVKGSLAISIPLLRKLSIIVFSLWLLMVFTNLLQTTLLSLSSPLTTVNNACVLIWGILLLGAPSLLSSSFVSPPVRYPIQSEVLDSPFLLLRWLSLLFSPTTHCHMLSIFARPVLVRSSCVMVFVLDENQPTPLLRRLNSFLPLPLILFLSKVATPSVGPRTLASSLTCIKCSLIISLSSSTLRTTVMALTPFLSLLNTLSRPSPSLPLVCNKLGQLLALLFLPLTPHAQVCSPPPIVLLKLFAPPPLLSVCKPHSPALLQPNLLTMTEK